MTKLDSSDNPKDIEMVPIEVLKSPSIDQMEVDPVLETEPERESLMTLIKNILQNGTLPMKKSERWAVVRKASRYVIQDRALYR